MSLYRSPQGMHTCGNIYSSGWLDIVELVRNLFIHRPASFVMMGVATDIQIHPIFSKQVFQSIHSGYIVGIPRGKVCNVHTFLKGLGR